MMLVKDLLTPQPSSTVQRFKFNSRSQQDTETVSLFVAELKKLSEHCEFGDSLDNMLRDRLVCGLRDVKVQRRLLAEGKLIPRLHDTIFPCQHDTLRLGTVRFG